MGRRLNIRGLIGIGLLLLAHQAPAVSAGAESPGYFCRLAESLSCHDASSGALLWRSKTASAPGELLLTPQRVWVTQSAELLAFDAGTGRPTIRIPFSARLFQPRRVEDRLLTTDEAGWLTAVDADNGNSLWRRRLSEQWIYPPAVRQGRLYTGGAGGVIMALSAADGAELWRRELGQELVYAPVLSGDLLWVSTFDGHLRGLDPVDGRIRFDRRLEAPLFDLQATPGRLLGADYSGSLLAFDTRERNLLWRKKVSESQRFGFTLNWPWLLSRGQDGAL